MLSWFNLGFIFLISLTSSYASISHAVNDSNMSPEILDIKGKLEDVIAKRYRERIATQIDVNAFSVSVQIHLKENPLKVIKNKTKIPEDTKQDISSYNLRDAPRELLIGHIQLESLILQYKQELAKFNGEKTPESKIQAEDVNLYNTNKFNRYEITKVQIWVGLDKGFSAKYKAEFQTWLSESITSEFGQNEEHKVFTIQKATIIEKPVVLNVWERISNFQILLGFALIAAFLFFSTIITKTLPSRDVKDQIKMAVQIEEIKNSHKQTMSVPEKKSNKNEKSDKSDNEQNYDMAVLHSSYRDLQSKVAYLLTGNQLLFENIVAAWLEMDQNGRMKITSVIDALLYKQGLRDSSELREHFQFPVRLSADKNIGLALKKFSELDFEERSFILEDAYCELLSVRMLGDGAIKGKFNSLANLPAEKLQKILTSQSSKVQALALLHLPEAKLKNYLSELNIEAKKKIIEESVRLEKITEQELDVLDETLRYQITQESAQNGMIEIAPMIPNLLATLSVREEFEILKGIAAKSRDGGLAIKRAYPSLVFMEEWPAEEVQMFFNRIEINLVQAYLQVNPSATAMIVKTLPKKTGQILQDEMSSGKKLSDIELDKNLLQLKYRLLKLVNDETILLEKIFRKNNPSEVAA